ncbi:peptide MFS transporter [Chondromyces apiculatus]|uniref:Di-/tripeptide transporter n=1 Tax=Chondromyces apiculatus DSM 436 TaxID=1192034 RepID=A0A017TJ11_9BACT|nr:peptide MFS transporter [Chondromyces apiculatus]EYF08581.1 Di-/tripeptide transporter [Chondromyces apiculatus DSM 436]
MSSSAAPAGESGSPADQATPKGHPTGLYVLFATEMWERFSYYGMRALLVLYFVSYLGWNPGDSSQVYKWYTSLVYLTPLIGGWLADRYLGLRAAIITGGVLMAIGHFLMALEPLPAMIAALGFLILGNGFFKPNLSTLVGRMYRDNDQRRDGAFTIYYMGVNLGAFFSPLVCGYLRDRFGFHYGFGAAGVGMVIGLLIFLAGQGKVLAAVKAAGNDLRTAREIAKTDAEVAKRDPAHAAEINDPVTRDAHDAHEPGATGFAGIISQGMPLLMLALAVVLPVKYAIDVVRGEAHWTDLIMPIAFGAIAGWMGVTLRTLKGATRDKSSVIFALFFFSVIFWMAFEQAGNALNLWAEFQTDRHLVFVEFPAEWYQSVNPFFIVSLGPVFAALWVWLARRSVNLSIPGKMAICMFFVALSFLAMVGAGISENGTATSVPLKELPARVDLAKINAGRTSFDPAKGELATRGAFPSYAIKQALEPAVDPAYLTSLNELEKASKNASEKRPVPMKIAALPEGFQLLFTDKQKERIVSAWDPATATLTLKGAVDVDAKIQLLRAGAPKEYQEALQTLADRSNAARVSGLWLILSYFLATIAELCLSPVGLSMVTKLAPARFASLFMGVWMLASSVAQYVGGSLGESWGVITPTSYFSIFVYSSGIGAVLLALLVKPLKKLTHGVT